MVSASRKGYDIAIVVVQMLIVSYSLFLNLRDLRTETKNLCMAREYVKSICCHVSTIELSAYRFLILISSAKKLSCMVQS